MAYDKALHGTPCPHGVSSLSSEGCGNCVQDELAALRERVKMAETMADYGLEQHDALCGVCRRDPHRADDYVNGACRDWSRYRLARQR